MKQHPIMCAAAVLMAILPTHGQNQSGQGTAGATSSGSSQNATVPPDQTAPPNQTAPNQTAPVGTANQLTFTNRIVVDYGTNSFGSNGLSFSNHFGGRSNRFGFTNEFGHHTNRFRETNEFGRRTNRFERTNEFGSESNRLHSTNRVVVVTNQFGATNIVVLSNGLPFPGAAVGGGAAVFPEAGAGAAPGPAPAPGQGAGEQPNPTPAGQGVGSSRVAPKEPVPPGQTGFAFQDRTVTETDRSLLLKLRNTVVPRLEAMGGSGPAVHFWVRDGIVRVVGTVQTPELRDSVLRLTQVVPGVHDVEDQLHVGNVDPAASPEDRALTFRVRETVLPQLQASGSHSPVDFTARDGLVRITGSVANPEESSRVAQFVQQVPGVKEVRNEAVVASGEPASTPSSTVGSADYARPTGSTNLAPTGRTNSEDAPAFPQQQPIPPSATEKPGATPTNSFTPPQSNP